MPHATTLAPATANMTSSRAADASASSTSPPGGGACAPGANNGKMNGGDGDSESIMSISVKERKGSGEEGTTGSIREEEEQDRGAFAYFDPHRDTMWGDSVCEFDVPPTEDLPYNKTGYVCCAPFVFFTISLSPSMCIMRIPLIPVTPPPPGGRRPGGGYF